VKSFIRLVGALIVLAAGVNGHAATPLDTQDYDLFFGDFNGDGKTDVLYVAKNPANASGINLSDGTGPNIPWQSWPSNFQNITWSTSQYNIIVADFNGDGKADIFLQSIAPGQYSYLLITDTTGHVVSAIQQLAYNALGATLQWTADQHHLVAGDFNGDGRADLLLQATSPTGVNAIVTANADGTLTVVSQSWSDNYLGFKWATSEANVFAGDFNGDGYADLLIQAKPTWVMIDYDVPFPVPTFSPTANGFIPSHGGTQPFTLAGVQSWGRMSDGVDWSPLTNTIIVGKLTGSVQADVILQGLHSGQTSAELKGSISGAIFGTGISLANNVTWTADSNRLYVANFSGSSPGLYLQAVSPTGTNYYVTGISNSVASVTTPSSPVANEMLVYTYDALGRLATASHTGAVNNGVLAGYSYDSAGNRTNVTVTGSPNSTQPP